MSLSDYIIKDFKPLTLKNSVNEAQQLCELFPVSHIPVLENGKLIGNFLQSDIHTFQDGEEKLSNYVDLLVYFSCNSAPSTLELLSLFAVNNTNIMPVTDHQSYLGYFDLLDVLNEFASNPFLASGSFDLIVEKNNKEYTMSEVTQIVESNNARVLGCFISAQDLDKTQITIKVDSQEINDIIQAFRRYNYTVLTSHTDDEYLEELKERAAYLEKYLNT